MVTTTNDPAVPADVAAIDPAGPAHVVLTDAPAHAVLVEEAEHHGATFLGMGPEGWVGVAMLLFLLILIWKGVFRSITSLLDAKIAAIRSQLEEARNLRAEAETLREEYSAKIANAEKDAAAMLAQARTEADTIVANAEVESAAIIARRQKMAEEKIAAAERSAVEEIRAKAATTAAAAARRLIVEKFEVQADRQLVDQAIAGL
ncbi:hypothetical protein [Altericroceibacterium xinjiangense]|uniref:F0F1 ATP synthase subunit B family protein n=1 Tax=Altericroceibacterium xinjiangense TaxID=762261 RepID=UPI001F497D03|nr:hypothetical protein [Altericroceibacterium xinjiangense]